MNKHDSYFYLLWKTFWSSINILSVLIGTIFTVLLWILKPENTVTLAVFLTCIIIFLILLICFIRFSINLYSEKKQKCSVLAIRESYGNYKDNNTVIALTSYIDYFTDNGLVSIFILENDFERQIALGKIINIQEDKKVQILLFNIDEEFSCDKLLRNNKDFNEKLRIKPIIKITSLEELNYGK